MTSWENVIWILCAFNLAQYFHHPTLDIEDVAGSDLKTNQLPIEYKFIASKDKNKCLMFMC